MFFGYSTVRTSNDGLCVGNNAVYPRQELSRCLRILKDDFVMRYVSIFGRSAIRPPSISANSLKESLRFLSSWSVAEPVQEPLNGAGRGIVNYLHMRKARIFLPLTISIKRYCAQNRALSLAPSSSRAAFRSEKRFIQLYQSNETVSRIPISHGLTHFMGHQPCGFVISDLQDPLHLRYRHAYFIHCHMIDQPIPLDQRCTGLMEYSACSQTDFCSTGLAIKDLSRADKPGFAMSTSGAPESLRPPHFSQMARAGFFRREFLLKLKQAPFSVSFCHGYTP